MTTPTRERLAVYAKSPMEFRKDLVIEAAHGPAPFGKVMASFQVRDFTVLDQSLVAVATGKEPHPGRFWWERTKGGSKDSDLTTGILWLLAFSPRALLVQIGASDRDQANEILKVTKSFLRLNPWLNQLVKVQSWTILRPATESRAEIIPADVAGTHGSRPDVTVINELSHIPRQEFAEIMLDNAAKMPRGLVCIATNAGTLGTWQHKLREVVRENPRWYFSKLDRPAPWISQAEVADRQRATAPQRFARLWQGEWVSGDGDALCHEDVQAAINQSGPMTGAEEGWVFYGGLDLSTSKDLSSLVIVGLSGGRLRLAKVQAWAPGRLAGFLGRKIDLAAIERAVVEANAQYNLHVVAYDPYQCELLAQRCVDQGVAMHPFTFSAVNLQVMAGGIIELFASHRIDLFPDEGLLRDVGKLRIVDKGMNFRLDAVRDADGHADRGFAFALACLAAEKFPSMAWGPGSISWAKGPNGCGDSWFAPGTVPDGVFYDAARDDGSTRLTCESDLPQKWWS